MRIKSFYGNTVEDAVAQARREMGEDAMLVESRRAPLEARGLGTYEVVCALVPEAEAAPAPPPADVPGDRLARELAEMRRQLDAMGKTIIRSAWSGRHAAGPETSEWHARLLAADLEDQLAAEILEGATQRAAVSVGLEEAVTAELTARIRIAGGLTDGAPAAMALAGPPGAGKTTTIVKLAVRYGLAAARPVALISMDDFRVAGAEQLRTYAAILGVGFQSFDNLRGLGQALDEHAGKRLVLIDTPGYGPRDMDRAADLARFLRSRPAVATHLTLTANLKPADLTDVADRFEIFGPAGLVFTRLDETAAFGSAFSLSVRRGMPISFLGTGQEIPEDLAPASPERILDAVMATLPRVRRLAA